VRSIIEFFTIANALEQKRLFIKAFFC